MRIPIYCEPGTTITAITCTTVYHNDSDEQEVDKIKRKKQKKKNI